jgi:hypothetical protein
LRSSAGIGVFVSDANDNAHWVETGRCYERFALQATVLGIRNAFLNQAVEVGSIRPQFAAALRLGKLRPDLVVRFGRGPTLPLPMRQPVQSVLVNFNERGLIESVRVEARAAPVGNTVVPTSWEGRRSNYQEHDAMLVPLTTEASWLGLDRRKPYWRGTITSITYEFSKS